MGRKRPYSLLYAPSVQQHLRAIDARHYPLIRRTIEEKLQHEPATETRNRKPLKRPIVFEVDAEWELRFGPNNRFRNFYDVDQERREVRILAIGVDERDRLFLGGEEVEP